MNIFFIILTVSEGLGPFEEGPAPGLSPGHSPADPFEDPSDGAGKI